MILTYSSYYNFFLRGSEYNSIIYAEMALFYYYYGELRHITFLCVRAKPGTSPIPIPLSFRLFLFMPKPY